MRSLKRAESAGAGRKDIVRTVRYQEYQRSSSSIVSPPSNLMTGARQLTQVCSLAATPAAALGKVQGLKGGARSPGRCQLGFRSSSSRSLMHAHCMSGGGEELEGGGQGVEEAQCGGTVEDGD
jgi:hypothetical protein